ncbi:hypothetical protein [Streptomyces sp. NPDC001985]|uniref:hypothetical protein n=1 Tax=Streptomyces sp. NPDC001985 TaxID=3154406 RepID=UPI0033209352
MSTPKRLLAARAVTTVTTVTTSAGPASVTAAADADVTRGTRDDHSPEARAAPRTDRP